MDGQTDDFEELSELLFKARERYRSVRAKILHAVDGSVAEESNRRFVDWRFDQGSPGMAIVGKQGPPEREDFYYDYESNSEEQIYLWHQKPNLWREEICEPGGQLKEAEVHGGKNGPRWTYKKYGQEQDDHAVYMPRIPESQETDTQFSFMLDPSKELCYYALDDTVIRKTGRRTNMAGREVVEVLAETISWGYPPSIFSGFDAPDGTTDHLLLIDAKIGTILRVAARLEGREFYVAEVTEIAYDEQFPGTTFRLELPGVEFEQFDIPDYEK